MRWQLQDPEVRAQGLAGLHVRLQARAVQLALPARAAAARTSSSSPSAIAGVDADGRRHRRRRASTRSTASSTAPGFKTTDFMFPMEITGRRRPRRCARRGRGGAHAHLGHHRAGLPVAVRHVRAQHEHLGRLDHRLPRGAGGLHPPGARSTCATAARRRIDVRPEVEAASDRELQARFAGTAWTQCDSWYRDDHGPDRRQLAGLHARVRRRPRARSTRPTSRSSPGPSRSRRPERQRAEGRGARRRPSPTATTARNVARSRRVRRRSESA